MTRYLARDPDGYVHSTEDEEQWKEWLDKGWTMGSDLVRLRLVNYGMGENDERFDLRV
jgi:hypothetical protein